MAGGGDIQYLITLRKLEIHLVKELCCFEVCFGMGLLTMSDSSEITRLRAYLPCTRLLKNHEDTTRVNRLVLVKVTYLYTVSSVCETEAKERSER